MSRLPETLRAGLRLPVIAAPMFLVSDDRSVIAQCRAGVIGAFPTSNARDTSTLDAWLDTITSALADDRVAGRPPAPWAANLVTHRTNDRLSEELALVAEYEPPIVITALGGPQPVIERVRSYGGVVLADVNSLTYAKKALDVGADGLVLVSTGAGGHTGTIAGLAFLAAVRQFFDGPVALGGGIATGGGVRAVEVAGADLAVMGTAFIPTLESMAAEAYKQMVVEGAIGDLVYTDAITGVKAFWLRQSIRNAGLDPDNLLKTFETNFASTGDAEQEMRRARWKTVWSAGHGIDCADRIEPTQAFVDRLAADYWAAADRPPIWPRELPTAEYAVGPSPLAV